MSPVVRWRPSLALCVAVAIASGLAGAQSIASTEGSELAWPEIRSENRPGCYWWWPGSAVDKANLAWNLKTLREAGVGGVHVIPIYGVKGQEQRYLEFLGPAWMEMLAHAVAEADRLGMWVDVTTGTGWPFGGPWVSDDDADLVARYANGRVVTKVGRQVKRPAPGGVGNCVNPYSSDALRRYLEPFDRAWAGYQGKMPRAQYHDSFEYAGNWSNQLFDAFKARRGYDLRDHLAELFGKGDHELVARIKSDYRETLSDLHLDFIETWVHWAKDKGCLARNQAHGAPGNLLDLYAAAHIPETETFGATPFPIPGLRRDRWNTREGGNSVPLANRFASSAAHVMGKSLVSAETCTWLRNHFTTSLAQMKPEIDQLLVVGINHMVYHGCCYSPREATWPGWLFYASIEFNPRNAFWRDVPALNHYVARCQSILQSGSPANDILLYWPVYDVWHDSRGLEQMFTVHRPTWIMNQPCGRVADTLVKHGFAFDFISDKQLRTVRAEPGKLTAPGGAYRVVLAPKCDHMPSSTWKQLVDLAAQGATILVHEALPGDVPGHGNLEARRKEFHATTARLVFKQIEDSPIQRAKIGRGQVLLSDDLEALLKTANVEPEPVAQLGIGFARRNHAEGRHYFLANLGNKTVDQWVRLGTPCQSVVVMDPRSDATGIGKVRRQDGRAEVYLQLAPGESRILRTFERKVDGRPWPYWRDAGAPLAIEGPWRVEFIEGGPALPAPFTTNRLASWTTLGDEESRRFAGTARYAVEFELPPGDHDGWMLDLGDVRESAAFRLNGHRVGTVWSIPFRASVGDYLREGKNLLEIDVTNLSANRIRDLDRRGVPWRIFHDINFVTHDYKIFNASRWPLMESGLLGPVLLQPLARQ